MKRFQHLLDDLPRNCVLDGEICVLDSDGRPRFNDLLFGRGQPTFIVFVAKRYGLQKSELFIGCGRKLYETVCEMDLEGVVCKRLSDSYSPNTRWWKVLNGGYSQKEGRGELFERRAG